VRSCLAALVFAAGLWSQQQPTTPEGILIMRVRVVASQNLARLPDYTCLQTVERFERSAANRPFVPTDTIRLEVALVGGKELFTWPGSGKFDDRNIWEIVGGGAIGNGNFALQARNVFVANGAVYEKAGEVEERGRRLLRYRYRVPKDRSGYSVRTRDDKETVAFYGTFDVDAVTLDLARLEVNATDISPRMAIRSVSEAMRYEKARIGGSAFLLPESSEMVMTYADGGASRNVTRFSGCRQYAGESVVSFSDIPDPDAVPEPTIATPSRAIELEPGKQFFLHLESGIRFGEHAAGDPFQARLTGDVRQDGRIVAPKGSLVRGRVTRLEKRRLRRGRGPAARDVESLIAGIELTEIVVPGVYLPVNATLDEVRVAAVQRIYLGRLGELDENTFVLEGVEVPRGMLTTWRTRGEP
jgi:hypothetical protein